MRQILLPYLYVHFDSQIPPPLSEEQENERKRKEMERKKAQKKAKQDRQKEKRAEEAAREAEEREKNRFLALSDREKVKGIKYAFLVWWLTYFA